jgi:hypothetical protein
VKQRKKIGYVETYHPMGAVQVSGLDVRTDAEFVVTFTRLVDRQREMDRLRTLYGMNWAKWVAQEVRDLWEQRDAIRAQHPRFTMEQAVKIINNDFLKVAA